MDTTPDDSRPGEQLPAPPPELTDHQALLGRIEAHAVAVVSTEPDHQKRSQLLSLFADEIGVPISTKIAQAYIDRARAALLGVAEPRQLGDPLDTRPVPWLWEGVLMPDCINLVVGLPKVGKSSLMVSLLQSWANGATEHLGANVLGHCPPCFIVGTDQPESDWAQIIGTPELPMPFVALWSSGVPLYLTDEGIGVLARHAEANPGALFLIDSYYACTAPLGLEENSPAYAAPLLRLQAAVSPFKATLVVLHHSNKNAGTGSATAASRGTTALPAIASQTIAMAWLKPTEGAQHDRRVVLKAEGRGGKPTQLLLERTDTGWVSHGDAGSVMAAEARAEAEEALTDRQTDALAYIEDRGAMGFTVTAKELGAHLNIPAPRAHKTLASLQRAGLIRTAGETIPQLNGGRPSKLFEPAGGVCPQKGEIGEERDLSPLARTERICLSPSSSSSPLYEDTPQGGDFPLPPLGTHLQVQRSGIWSNGWVLSAAASPHDITAERRTDPTVKLHGLRWGVDCRACQAP